VNNHLVFAPKASPNGVRGKATDGTQSDRRSSSTAAAKESPTALKEERTECTALGSE